jgi:hypothetical protein
MRAFGDVLSEPDALKEGAGLFLSDALRPPEDFDLGEHDVA